MIRFQPQSHVYYHPETPDRKWLSITGVVGMLHEKFDPHQGSVKSSQNKKSKWYGMRPEVIQNIWEGEKNRSTDLGKWYHDKREQSLYTGPGNVLVHKPLYEGDEKVARNQRLEDGIYPEHIVYLDSAGLAGQTDKVIVKDGRLSVRDYKTNKEIRRQGFVNWEGVEKKMLKPLQHMSDCELSYYTLQLSLYAYIILRYNPHLKLQELVIEHIQFEKEKDDEYGYPVYRKDDNEDYIVKWIEEIPVEYKKREVELILNWLKTK